MSRTEAEQQTLQIIHRINASLDGQQIGTNDIRVVYAASAFDISLEHAQSFALLCREGHWSSCAAILRPQLELCLRGHWILKCALDEFIHRLDEEPSFPKFKKLSSEVEKSYGVENSRLLDSINLNWNMLNSMTHGGFQLLARRVKDGMFQPSFSEDDLIRMNQFCVSTALLSAAGLVEATGNTILAESLSHITTTFSSLIEGQ